MYISIQAKLVNILFWSQSYDRDLQRRRCKNNGTKSLARFDNRSIFF
jgi:hypothetical protein